MRPWWRRLWEWIMSTLHAKGHGKPKPVDTLSVTDFTLDEGGSQPIVGLRNGHPIGLVSASSSDPRWTVSIDAAGQAIATFVGPADPALLIDADFSLVFPDA